MYVIMSVSPQKVLEGRCVLEIGGVLWVLDHGLKLFYDFTKKEIQLSLNIMNYPLQGGGNRLAPREFMGKTAH